MKEKEVRARIEQFLRTTARNVVVPASLGFGLTASGCDSHALHTVVDAGRDVVAHVSDATVAPDLRDAASELSLPNPPYLAPPPPPDAANDLPIMAVPYLVVLPPDAAPPDQSGDTLESEAGAHSADASPDEYVPLPPLIYVVFMQQQPGLEPSGRPEAKASDKVAQPPASPQKA